MSETEPFIDEADPFDIAPVRLTVDLAALADNWLELSRRSWPCPGRSSGKG